MNFIFVIHLMCYHDLIVHNKAETAATETTTFTGATKGGGALVYVASVASAVYDQVSQLVPVQQVDDIDEVHQLDPVHQVDHKDECSKISLQKRHHKMDQPGFKKKSNFWLTFSNFLVDFSEHFGWPFFNFLVDFWVDPGVNFGQFLGRPEADF